MSPFHPASSASKHQKVIPFRLAASKSSASGWTPINRPRALSAAIHKSPSRQRVEKQQKFKGQKKTPSKKSSDQRPTDRSHNGSASEPAYDLTLNERDQWEHEFDRVLQSSQAPEEELPELPTLPHSSSSEDDLPELSDLPDLARTTSKTPLRSSTCPPTPRSRSTKSFAPSSKSGSQFDGVVILDSEDDSDEDLMSGVEEDNHQRNMQPLERRVRAHSSVSAYNPDASEGANARAPTHDPSIRSRRNWPS